MTSGEQGRTAPDAEHYLDLSDLPEEASGPRFDVVLRGYDRRQVDEHVAGLRRMVSQLRAQLAVRERRRGSADGGVDGSLADTISEGRPAGRGAAPAPHGATRPASPAPDAPATTPVAERSDAGGNGNGGGGNGGGPDMVGAFNDRLRGILQAAEQEAQMVRSRAAESLLAEHAESRAALAELRAQRDAVFDELLRARNRLDDIVAHSGRPSAPPRGAWGAPAGPVPPRGPYGGGPPGAFGAAPGPRGPGADHADVDADTAGDSGELTVEAVAGAGRGNGAGTGRS